MDDDGKQAVADAFARIMERRHPGTRWTGYMSAEVAEEEPRKDELRSRLRAAESRRQEIDRERSEIADQLRDLILEARGAGMKPAEIAEAMGPDVNRQTVYRILGRR